MNQQLRGNERYHFETFACVLGYYPIDVPGERRRIFLNEEMLSCEERGNQLWFERWEPDPLGDKPIRPRIYRQSFPIPRTIEQAFDCAVQAGAWDNTPEGRKDFFRSYALSHIL